MDLATHLPTVATTDGARLIFCGPACSSSWELSPGRQLIAVGAGLDVGDAEAVSFGTCSHCARCGTRALVDVSCALCEGDGCPQVMWSRSLDAALLLGYATTLMAGYDHPADTAGPRSVGESPETLLVARASVSLPLEVGDALDRLPVTGEDREVLEQCAALFG